MYGKKGNTFVQSMMETLFPLTATGKWKPTRSVPEVRYNDWYMSLFVCSWAIAQFIFVIVVVFLTDEMNYDFGGPVYGFTIVSTILCVLVVALCIRSAVADASEIEGDRVLISRANVTVERNKGIAFLNELVKQEKIELLINDLALEVLLFLAALMATTLPLTSVVFRPDLFNSSTIFALTVVASVVLAAFAPILVILALGYFVFFRSKYSGFVKLGMHHYLRPPGFYRQECVLITLMMLFFVELPGAVGFGLYSIAGNSGLLPFMALVLTVGWVVVSFGALLFGFVAGHSDLAKVVREYNMLSKEDLQVLQLAMEQFSKLASKSTKLAVLYERCLKLRSKGKFFLHHMPMNPTEFLATIRVREKGTWLSPLVPFPDIIAALTRVGGRDPMAVVDAYLEKGYIEQIEEAAWEDIRADYRGARHYADLHGDYMDQDITEFSNILAEEQRQAEEAARSRDDHKSSSWKSSTTSTSYNPPPPGGSNH